MPRIPALHVGRAVPAGPVTLFPVWADVRPVPGLLTGAHAQVQVSELSSGATVGRLSVYNSCDKPVLLLEGELLEGGNQTRACVRDLIVDPGSSADIDVVCVEQGRWSFAGLHGRRARRATATVQRALRGGDGRQSAVWDGVRRYDAATGPTLSGSLADHLDRVVAPVPPRLLAGQNGVVVGVAGHPVTLELFGSRRALAAHLPASSRRPRSRRCWRGRPNPSRPGAPAVSPRPSKVWRGARPAPTPARPGRPEPSVSRCARSPPAAGSRTSRR